MHRNLMLWAFSLALACGGNAAFPGEWPADSFAIVCYHDVRDHLAERPDSYTLETGQLAVQFTWLRENGYHVVSFGDVVAARREHRALPQKTVVLSFDDGLASVYTRVFPLLKAFRYPAVVGLVGAWLAEPAAGQPSPEYPDATLTRSDFLRPDQILEMQRSGLIEFASHTYAMHRGVPANPQGNLEPAAVTHQFTPNGGGYESDAAHTLRVGHDLVRSSEDIARLSGVRPRIVVWPYGAHDANTDRLASAAGMPYGMTLELGLNTPDVPLQSLRRILVTEDFTAAALARALEETPRAEPLRMIRVSLDTVYDEDPVRQEAKLSRLLDRVQALGPNTVVLQAFAGPGPDGRARALYFPNRLLPVRADLFNRVAWQLRTRTGVAVYGWLPLFDFALPAQTPDPRAAIAQIYADFSQNAPIQGLVFSEDTSGDAEDGIEFSATLAAGVRADHDSLRTARQLAVLRVQPGPERFSARLAAMLSAYDHVMLVVEPDAPLAPLITAVAREPQGLTKSVFELAGADRSRHDAPVGAGALAAQMDRLRRAGALSYGYYPDDPRDGLPGIEVLRPALSLKSLPTVD